jgi:hypothetical protein
MRNPGAKRGISSSIAARRSPGQATAGGNEGHRRKTAFGAKRKLDSR